MLSMWIVVLPLWGWCYLHWHPHYSVFRRLRLIGGLNQYYCFTWIKSLQGPHPVPCSRTLQNLLDEGLLRALKGHCGGGHVEGSDGENFSFLHGGSSAGAALELPHCHLAPGAATKSWAHTIPILGQLRTLAFDCQVQAVHLPTLKSCRPSAVKQEHPRASLSLSKSHYVHPLNPPFNYLAIAKIQNLKLILGQG